MNVHPKAYPLSIERRRRYLMAKFPIAQLKVLELGALDMPTFETSETCIEFMDYHSDEEFAALAKQGKISRPLEKLVPVRHVVKSKHFAQNIEERFDLIIAAHVIEHIPDPLCWLAELSSLLTPTGSIFLPIPDKRYTLDKLRRESSVFDMLKAFNAEAEEPDVYQVADFLYFKRSVRWVDVWAGADSVSEALAKSECSVPQAMERAKSLIANGLAHVNVHCHVFSAPTFAELFKGMRETGIIPLDLSDVVDVQINGNEFWALLTRQKVIAPANRKATKARKFISGRNDYLFLDNDTNETISQMTGRAQLSPQVLGKWRRLISSRKHLLEAQGADYRFVIAPAKEAVLNNELPEGLSLSENRPAIQIKNVPSISDIVIYPLEELRQSHREGRATYPKGETHWTDDGALVVYQTICAKWTATAGDSILTRDKLQSGSEVILGDLAVHAGRAPETVTTLFQRNPRHTVTRDNRRRNRGRIVETENPSASGGSIIVFGDSFFTKLIPFFAESFSKLIFVWNPFVDHDLVEIERPDFVLNVMAERFLPVVPDDTHKFSWEEIELLNRVKG